MLSEAKEKKIFKKEAVVSKTMHQKHINKIMITNPMLDLAIKMITFAQVIQIFNLKSVVGLHLAALLLPSSVP